MNVFLALLRPDANRVEESACDAHARAACCRSLSQRWHHELGTSVLLAGDGLGVPQTHEHHNSWSAVGAVRLDNRDELLRRYGGKDSSTSDLGLVLRALAADYVTVIPQLLGDFALVAWDRCAQRIVAIRDAFGVRKLYWRKNKDYLAFSSRADILATDEKYSAAYLTRLIATSELELSETAYEGVEAIPAGHYLTANNGHATTHQYWTPRAFEPSAAAFSDIGSACREFRHLHSEAVRHRLPETPTAWATLSGGLDSSSVVSMAEAMRREGRVANGVSGTVSWVYRWSREGDERQYSSVVAQAFGVPNHVVEDCWFWQNDGAAPPLTDQPDPAYAIYARDRLTARVARNAGASVLLTGFGADHYLLGNMFFFADWLVSGRLRHALVEMAHRAATGRVSFWQLAFQNAALPLLPRFLQRRVVRAMRTPQWLTRAATERWVTQARIGAAAEYAGRAGRKYGDLVATSMLSIPRLLSMYAVLDLTLDLRHPFLYRPLVEFALRLPPEACVQPYARKWILREAMNGILPERIRTRIGKGSNGACIGQSLIAERDSIERIVKRSVLADLGCIEPTRLRAALDSATRSGRTEDCATIAWTLAVDTWLQVRSGRWTEGNGHRAHAG